MKIDFEMIKTILLIFLVSLSLLLTLGIWTYQGDYEPSSSDLVTDAQLNGTDQTKKNLVQPSQIVFHDNGELSGFSEKGLELEVFQDITEWQLYDFSMIPEDEEVTINETAQSIEIIFPTSIPSSIINEIFTTDDTMLIDSKFKSIYILIDPNRANQQIVFKNSDQNGIDIQASVQNIAEVVEYFNRTQLVNDFIQYVEVELANERKVYIPNGESNILGKKFRYEVINADSTNFQNIFFRNPSTIASSPNSEGGQVYSDGQREVVVKGYAMEYTDFSTSENRRESENLPETASNWSDYLVTSSIDYINRHDGWLVDQDIQYRLYNLNEISNIVEYRMMYQNFPIFSKEGLSTISVVYQNLAEYQYSRPLMQLTFSYDRATTNLMTGEQLVDYLEQSDRFSFNEIVDIQLGYRIEQQAGGQVFDLIPTWCIETYSGWQYVTSDANPVTQGGETNAMGPN
ncbi:YycH family regulatory protein [Gracilibacillus sp. HCP3S3_G5_1]|uniref:YycH family regulatory protein n=1 Tax=unclassified Gracilibacillus TaxID=2625209 RepID=UPI003F8A9DBD